MNQETRPASSTRQLFGAVHDFVALHPGLDENGVDLMSYFAFATLFPEFARVWPFVSVVTNDAAASTLFLRILKFVFAQPVHLAECSLAGLLSLPESPGQVLLIDQPAPSKELLRVLRLVSRPGACVPWKGDCEKFRPWFCVQRSPLRSSTSRTSDSDPIGTNAQRPAETRFGIGRRHLKRNARQAPSIS